MKDPARAVLDHVLRLTLEKRRFPKETFVRKRLSVPPSVLDRLLADGRYLLRLPLEVDAEPWPRLAVTTLGIHAAGTEESRVEVAGLARTHAHLADAVLDGVFAEGAVKVETLQRRIGSEIALADLRRWCTLLCSPRLQGRYDDPIGFCGLADASGEVDDNTGFFTRVCVRASFNEWRECLNPAPAAPAFLLAEGGLQTERDERRWVHVNLGTAEVGVLPPTMAARVFAALIAFPGYRLHSLDLQAHGDGCAAIKFDYEDTPSWALARLRKLGIANVDLDTWSSVEVTRLSAVLRRVQVLGSLARGKRPPPRFALDPDTDRQAVIARLNAALAKGRLRAEFSVIKNATRAVTRGLKGVLNRLLKDAALAPFRQDFQIGEWSMYSPARR